MNQKSFKQILAVMLAVSCVWIFAACILLCSYSVCEDELSNKAIITVNHEAHTLCPITETTETTTTDRVSFDSLSLKPLVHRQAFVFAPEILSLDFKPHKEIIITDTPLDVLPLIRI